MAQQDQTYTFGVTGATQEHHVGNGIGSTGANPKGPADSPSIPASVTVKPTNITVGSIHLVNPA